MVRGLLPLVAILLTCVNLFVAVPAGGSNSPLGHSAGTSTIRPSSVGPAMTVSRPNLPVSSGATRVGTVHTLRDVPVVRSSSVVLPAVGGAVAVLGVTIQNHAPNATSVPFQQMLRINSTALATYINSNWSNVLFSYLNGTLIPGWIESGASNQSNDTVLWIRLEVPVPANGSLTVAMNFFGKYSYLLYPRFPIGEAPYLSTPQGSHDNGAKVFLIYGGFQWATGAANWTAKNIDNTGVNAAYVPTFLGNASGVEMMNDKSEESTALGYNLSFTTQNITIEASWGYGSASSFMADDLGFGFYARGVNVATGAWAPSASEGYYASYEFFNSSFPAFLNNGVSTGVGVTPNPMPNSGNGPYYVFTQVNVNNTFFNMSFSRGASPFETGVYHGLTQTVKGLFSSVNPYSVTNGRFYVGSSTGATSSFQYLYWLRVRALPPNGTMPTVTLSSPLFGGAVHPGTDSVDAGQTAHLFVHAVSGGSTPYTYQWYEYPGTWKTCHTSSPISGAQGTELNATPTSNTSYCYTVQDSVGLNTSSFPGNVVVNGPLGAGAITPAQPTIEVGQSVNLTANPTGGTPPYIGYQWYEGTSASCAGEKALPGADLPTLTLRPVQNESICYSVQDSSTGTLSANNSSTVDVVTVVPHPIVRSFTSSRAQADVGQPVTFSASGAQGIGPYTFRWGTFAAGLNCTAPLAGNLSCAPRSPGTYTMAVAVTDSVGFTSPNATLNFTVYSLPVATPPLPSSTDVPVGSSVTFNETPSSDGSGGLGYHWGPAPGGATCAPAQNLDTCTFTTPGHYTVGVSITDSDGESSVANSTSVTVSPSGGNVVLSTVAVTPDPITVAPNTSTVFLATPTCTGGACPSGILYAWTLNNSLGSVSPSSSTYNSTTFTAKGALGTLTLTVKASLGSSSKVATTSIVISRATLPSIVSVAVAPNSVQVTEGAAQVFTATYQCQPVQCPSEAVSFSWVLSNASAGTLNSTNGASVSFTAGSSKETSALTVHATYQAHSVEATSQISVVPPASSGTSNNPELLGAPLSLWLLLLVVVIAVALAVAISRRRQARRKSPQEGKRSRPSSVSAPPPSVAPAPGVVAAATSGPLVAEPLPEWSEEGAESPGNATPAVEEASPPPTSNSPDPAPAPTPTPVPEPTTSAAPSDDPTDGGTQVDPPGADTPVEPASSPLPVAEPSSAKDTPGEPAPERGTSVASGPSAPDSPPAEAPSSPPASKKSPKMGKARSVVRKKKE